jgi:hypothetical protein
MTRAAKDPSVRKLPVGRAEWVKSEVSRLDDDLLNRMRERLQTVEPKPLPPDDEPFRQESFIAENAMECAGEFGRRHDLTPDECSVLVWGVLGMDESPGYFRKEYEMPDAGKLMMGLFKRFKVRSLPQLGLIVLQEALAGRWWEAHEGCGAK